MNTREIAAEYRLTHWAGVMRERKESGLSVKSFCEAAGFRENAYFYWQRKLRESACQELAQAQLNQPETGTVPNGWTQCEIAKASSTVNEPNTKSGVEIEIGKCHVHVTTGADYEVLAAVCGTLVGLC